MVHTVSEFVGRLRAFELELQRRMPEFRCAVHLCLGQEEVPDALHDGVRSDDWLFSTHRSHGHYLAKGGSEQKILDEILGLESGVNRGYSGSQSFCDVALNFHSTAIVGGLIAAATGAAFALKTQRSEALVVCCIGDGATEQGVFWESLNFAALHALNVLYIVENNRLSVHAPIEARQATAVLGRVRAFGVNTGLGIGDLRTSLSYRRCFPKVIEVPCNRDCAHVSAMEDLRE